MKVINLFGSAGAGKSTTALGLTHQLKINGYKVEDVSEYIYSIKIDAGTYEYFVAANRYISYLNE